MSTEPNQSFFASRRGRRTAFWVGLAVLVAGVAAATIAFFGNTAEKVPETKSNEPAQVFTPRKQIPLEVGARRAAGRFLLTAVPRKNLAESYELTHPDLRQGLSKKEWLTGNIPVQYYPADNLEIATFKVDESYADEAIIEVALLPKKGEDIKPQIFFIGLKKVGAGDSGKWKVHYFAPRAPPAIPNARE
ncbi:MAG TPA: hypothetical protein VNI55_05300 [Gaiellaceae bacterium]|nr:hypothetical protein [Gaiellaceae bacterium]